MRTASNLIHGPWPGKSSEDEPPVRLQRSDGAILEVFPDYETAIRYREEEELGEEWLIRDIRGGPSDHDRLLLLGMVLRDHFKRHWRHAQFDRLLHGEVREIPGTASDGLQDSTATVAAAALAEAGMTGWNTVAGYVAPKSALQQHAWLEREDGLVLDFMADSWGNTPLVIIQPEEKHLSRHRGGRDPVEAATNPAWQKDLADKISEVLPDASQEPEYSF